MKAILELQQKQVLSQQQIQSMRILEMNTQELKNYLDDLSLENPVVDLSEKKNQDNDDTLAKYMWLNSLNEQGSIPYNPPDPDDDMPSMEERIAADDSETLEDYLWSQLLTSDMDEKTAVCTKYFLGLLDNRGYFPHDVKEICRELSISPEKGEEILDRIKNLDPAGIGASSLAECLILQAKRQGILTPLIRELLENHLEDIAANRVSQLAREMKIKPSGIQEAFDVIRRLEPKPGARFSSREMLSYISPDVIIVRFRDHFQILLNEYLYPDIQVNDYYVRMMKNKPDEETVQYLKEKINQAEWVKKCIFRRGETLRRTAAEILGRQMEFFLEGPGHLSPMTQTQIADALEVHESTISRTVKGKYLQCSWGIFPLNYFFTAAVGKDGLEVSSRTVKERIKELISLENRKSPLSDQVISEKLTAEGMPISRRTVAKYRQEMEIPDTRKRRDFS